MSEGARIARAMDRTRFKAWWECAEAEVFKRLIQIDRDEIGEFLRSPALDLSNPVNVTKASRKQGEAAYIAKLLDDPETLLNELQKLANKD